ncbi:hypothetical protein GF374_02110 [Candidatus Woesearchaeota archaeon]|nr:hypothetical protein [Candidatus Woesearchaeota archaeon]
MFDILKHDISISKRELRLHRAMLTEDKNKFELLEKLDKELKSKLGSEETRKSIRELITLVSEERTKLQQAIKGLQKEIKNERKNLIKVAEKFDKREIRLDKKIKSDLKFELKELKKIEKDVKNFPKLEGIIKDLIELVKKELKQDKLAIRFDFKLLKDLKKQE